MFKKYADVLRVRSALHIVKFSRHAQNKFAIVVLCTFRAEGFSVRIAADVLDNPDNSLSLQSFRKIATF